MSKGLPSTAADSKVLYPKRNMQSVNIQTIDQAATVTLAAWSIFEVQLPSSKSPTNHLCGYRLETGRGKVSSAISAFDPATGRCMTRSGNVYELHGPPGANADALATRGQWLRMNHVLHELDVTQDFAAYLDGR